MQTDQQTSIPSSLFKKTITQNQTNFLSLVLRQVQADLYKLRRQRLVLILIFISLFLMALFWALETLLFSNNLDRGWNQPLRFAGDTREAHVIRYLKFFVLPNSLALSSMLALLILPIPLCILAATLIGTDYRSGTLRVLLSRGITRTHYLLGKLITFFCVATIATPLAIGLGISYQWIAAHILSPTISAPAFSLSWSWSGSTVLFIGTTIVGLFIYMALACCITIFSRSTAIGIAGSLIFWISEFLLNTSLTMKLNPFQDSVEGRFLGYLLTDNTANLLNWQLPLLVPRSHLTKFYVPGSYIPGGGPQRSAPYYLTLEPLSNIPSVVTGHNFGLSPLVQSVIVLSLYSLIFIGASWILLARRDITN